MMQLPARGKQRNKVTVAIARELSGLIWHLFQLVAPRMEQGDALQQESCLGGN